MCVFPHQNCSWRLLRTATENSRVAKALLRDLRWVSAATQEADKKFRRVQGYRDIEKLTKALEGIEAEEEAAAKRVA